VYTLAIDSKFIRTLPTAGALSRLFSQKDGQMVTRIRVNSSVVLYRSHDAWMVEVVDGFETLMFGYRNKRDAQKRASSEQKRLRIIAHVIPFPYHRIGKLRFTPVTGDLPTSV